MGHQILLKTVNMLHERWQRTADVVLQFACFLCYSDGSKDNVLGFYYTKGCVLFEKL